MKFITSLLLTILCIGIYCDSIYAQEQPLTYGFVIVGSSSPVPTITQLVTVTNYTCEVSSTNAYRAYYTLQNYCSVYVNDSYWYSYVSGVDQGNLGNVGQTVCNIICEYYGDNVFDPTFFSNFKIISSSAFVAPTILTVILAVIGHFAT